MVALHPGAAAPDPAGLCPGEELDASVFLEIPPAAAAGHHQDAAAAWQSAAEGRDAVAVVEEGLQLGVLGGEREPVDQGVGSASDA